MQNSDLNSIVALQRNNPEIFGKIYYLIERDKDGAIRHVHAYGMEPKPQFDYIKVEDGKIFLDGPSPLNEMISLIGYSDRDGVVDYLETVSSLREQHHNVTKVTIFETLDLTKVY